MELTYFAPAERASIENLERQINLFINRHADGAFGDALPVICLVLNAQRQIVYANARVLEALHLDEFSCIYGKRPGELFNCVHATEEAGGCGTSRYCENCGAVQAILMAQSGTQAVKECRLTLAGGISEDFRVMATPIEREGQSFTIFTLQDIQHEKRRQALERTFFHDLLNTAGGLSGLVEILQYVDQESEKEELMQLLQKTSDRLIEEIHSGRALSQAEDGRLQVNLGQHDLLDLARDTVGFYRSHSACQNRHLILDERSESVTARTDSALVHRIVGNLVKNALEASDDQGTVTVHIGRADDGGRISVHNDTVMSPTVKAQVFERSFSTKGTGRGIGTYSVRLFAEKYLQGSVGFSSEPGLGTTFHVTLPLEIKESG